MKPRKVTDKLRDELLALKNSRGTIDDLCFNYLNNFSENAKLTHFSLKGSSLIKSVAYRQYFVFLISSLETFFRDLFIYVHSIDTELMNKLLEKFKNIDKLHNSEELSSIEVLSKSFNFQNVNDLENAFDQLWGANFLDTICNTSINPCGFNGKVFQSVCVSNMFPDWESIFNEAFAIRHKVVHDANFRPDNNMKLAQEAESVFLLIPQLTTCFLAKKYKLKSIFLKAEGGDFPYIFSIHDILAEDWHVTE
jgi:hypothetical protein